MTIAKIQVVPIDPKNPEQIKEIEGLQLDALKGLRSVQGALTFIETSFNLARSACTILLAIGVLTGLFTIFGALITLLMEKPDTALVTVVLGALSATSFLGIYVLRPLDSMERNAILYPLVAGIMSTFLLRIAAASDNNEQIKNIVNDLVLQLGGVLDKHTAATNKYIEALKTKEDSPSSNDDSKKEENGGKENNADSGGSNAGGEAGAEGNKES